MDKDINWCLVETHLFGGFFYDWQNFEANGWLDQLRERYGEPLCGRNRAAFMTKNYVIKFPLNPGGEADNDWEGSCKYKHYARGKRFMIGSFICVIQERLDVEVGPYNKLPDWTYSIDGGQVGYDKNRILKAYDFGIC